jgi:anti-sigma B factor antagonist
MRISERREGDITILTLTGRMVLDEGDLALKDHIDDLVRQGRVKLLIDMKGVTFLDSAGIGMLVAKYLSVRRKGGAVKLMNLASRTDRPLSVTRLTTIFEIFDSTEEALRSFGTEPA